MRAFALLTAILLAAGCLGAVEAPEDVTPNAATNGTVEIDEDRPDAVFEEVVTGPVAPPDLEATLAEAPTWKVGEWWRIAFESPLSGESVEFVRVVAAIDGEQYVVGMPHEGWYKEAVIYHAPAFGDINVADLSYYTHDELFTPLKFPLEDGQTWETTFSGGGAMTAVVKVLDATTAQIEFFGQGGILAPVNGPPDEPTLTLVYDATIHEVREFRHPTAVYTVVEHGYDFEGWITIPRGEDLVFFHGRIGPAVDIGFQPAPPTETVTVAGGFNRVTFIQAVQNLGPAGVYRERAVAPDGTEFVTESIGPAGPFIVQFFEQKNPDGDWALEHVVAGAGVAFIEGIAYHQYDIRLPDGARRSDHAHEVVR